MTGSPLDVAEAPISDSCATQGPARSVRRRRQAAWAVSGAKPLGCAGFENETHGFASASSVSAVPRWRMERSLPKLLLVLSILSSVHSLVRPGIEYRESAPLAPGQLTMLTVLTIARTFGSSCCHCVLHERRQFQCPGRAMRSGPAAAGRRAPAGCVANRGGGSKCLGAAMCRRLAGNQRRFRPIRRG